MYRYLALFCIMSTYAIPPINLFRPSDRFLMPEPAFDCWFTQLSVGYEGSFHTRGFAADGDECLQIDIDQSGRVEKKTSVLQLYQPSQNVIAALQGADSKTERGQFAQQFIHAPTTRGLFVPCADLHVPMNLLLSSRYYFNHGLSFAFHLPVLLMELKNVHFRPCNVDAQNNSSDEKLLDELRQIANLELQGWRRAGIGDLVAQVTWMRDFPQAKPIISNVRVQTRFGIDFPTGTTQREDLLLGIPFGNDGAWGVQFAGGIDIDFLWTIRAGVDVEFLYLFGNTRNRRVKTAVDQTDLLFLDCEVVFRQFGLTQQYNLYIESYDFWRGLSAKLNYQLLKRNDDRIDICSDRISPHIANSAFSLQDWTAHSLIFGLRYEPFLGSTDCRYIPSFLAWIKWGFNGKRAILANTVGLQFNLAF